VDGKVAEQDGHLFPLAFEGHFWRSEFSRQGVWAYRTEVLAFGQWMEERQALMLTAMEVVGTFLPSLTLDPDQDAIILITGKPFRLNKVDLQVFDVVVIQVKSAFYGAVRDPLLTLKQLDNLGDQCVIFHGECSTGQACTR
jgi:hypothetical protein